MDNQSVIPFFMCTNPRGFSRINQVTKTRNFFFGFSTAPSCKICSTYPARNKRKADGITKHLQGLYKYHQTDYNMWWVIAREKIFSASLILSFFTRKLLLIFVKKVIQVNTLDRKLPVIIDNQFGRYRN